MLVTKVVVAREAPAEGPLDALGAHDRGIDFDIEDQRGVRG